MPNEHQHTFARETGIQFVISRGTTWNVDHTWGENLCDVYDVFGFCDFCVHPCSLQVGTADCMDCFDDDYTRLYCIYLQVHES